MKIHLALITLCLTAIIIFAAGCTSSNNAGTPTQGATAGGPKPTASGVKSLTEEQKVTATNIAKGDTTVKEVLAKSGYGITGVTPGSSTDGSIVATVFIEGGSTVHSDGSIWTPDIYQVTVNLGSGKVTNIEHIAPRSLPTPTAP